MLSNFLQITNKILLINDLIISHGRILKSINYFFTYDFLNIIFITFPVLIIFGVYSDFQHLNIKFIYHNGNNRLNLSVSKILGFKQSKSENSYTYPKTIFGNYDKYKFNYHVEEIIFMLDREGRILFANKTTMKEFKITSFNLQNKTIFDIYHYFGNYDTTWFDKLKKEGSINSILKIQEMDNKKWFFLSYYCNLDSRGNIETIVANGRDVSFLVNSEIVKEFYSETDILTGLFNEYGMVDYIKKSKNINTGIAFCIEVMNLIEIANYYGYEIKNQLLNEVVKDLKKFLANKCLVARYTDSRFVIICTNCDISEESISKYLETLGTFINKSYKIGNLNLQIDKKIGYAVYPKDTRNYEELISLSSIALKNAIHNNLFEINRFNNQMREDLRYNVEIANKLKIALDEGKIQVFFQKAINCKTKEVFVIEELSRWKDSEFGYIPPTVFFKIAKESNLLNRLEKYMVEKTLEAFIIIRKEDEFKKSKVTINITPTTLLDTHFFEYFNNKVDQLGLNPGDIYIEISESTFVNNIDLCLKHIDMYKSCGYMIALDDFGTEYSSLSILEGVDFDMIKIDAHFVQNIDKFSNQEIIKMIRTITSKTSKEIVAEGVETIEQSKALMDLGCQIQQGYYYHKPENLLR